MLPMALTQWQPAAFAGGGVSAGSILTALVYALRSVPPPQAPRAVAREEPDCICTPCPAPDPVVCPVAVGGLEHVREFLRRLASLDDTALGAVVAAVGSWLVSRLRFRPFRAPAAVRRLQGYLP